MTRQEYVMSVRNFWQWTSTLVHSVKQQWMSESKKFRASATREGGVDPARCTNLQKLPQKRSKQIGNLGGGGAGLWDQSATWKAGHGSWSEDSR